MADVTSISTASMIATTENTITTIMSCHPPHPRLLLRRPINVRQQMIWHYPMEESLMVKTHYNPLSPQLKVVGICWRDDIWWYFADVVFVIRKTTAVHTLPDGPLVPVNGKNTLQSFVAPPPSTTSSSNNPYNNGTAPFTATASTT